MASTAPRRCVCHCDCWCAGQGEPSRAERVRNALASLATHAVRPSFVIAAVDPTPPPCDWSGPRQNQCTHGAPSASAAAVVACNVDSLCVHALASGRSQELPSARVCLQK